jgi:hypothetical protein
VDWVRPLIERSPQVNPVPGLRELLAAVVAPHWLAFALLQTAGETLVAALLILGFLTRPAAVGGLLLAIGLSLTIAFLDADVGSRWLYYLAVLVNAQVLVAGPAARAWPGPPSRLRRWRWRSSSSPPACWFTRRRTWW